MIARLRLLVEHAVPPLWLALFLLLCLRGTSVAPWPAGWFFALAAVGWAHAAGFARLQLRELLGVHRALIGSAVVLAALIVMSEHVVVQNGLVPPHPLPPQPGLLLCLPPLVLFLADARRLRAVVLVFAALTAWHFVALPVEAITGAKVSWHAAEPLPRDAGPLHFQAAGLALQAYFFPGFFLPLFYLAWGPAPAPKRVPRWAWLALPPAWVLVAACVQSRSALFGAAAAALVALGAAAGARRARTWLIALALAALAVLLYVALFSENKSGGGLRVAYLQHYLALSFDRWLLVGHGLAIPPDPRLLVPGLQPLSHSHNDLAQVLYSWGLLALLAYAVFLLALARRIAQRAAAGEVWPLCAALTLLPSLLTDLGLHHFEKAAFLVWLAAFCLACPPRRELRP